MMAAEVNQETIRVLAEERQVTRLGESVFRTGRISEDALTFLSATLARMAAIYQKLSVDRVRAVATSAVRDAGNQEEFVARASAILGVGVEVISGPEESRLIQMGVESRWPRPKERTLIIDVGGGSTELIVCQAGQLIDAVSKPLGAVRLTELFLKNDPPKPEELHRMNQYIDEKLASFTKRHRNEKFDRAVATSASAAAVVSAVNELPRVRREESDRMRARTSQVRQLYANLSARDLAARRKVVGIGPRRAEIVIPGAAVFLKVLEGFRHHSIYYSAAGVRDGIIADFEMRGVGRELSQLSNEQRKVVETMAKRYGVSMKHIQKVAQIAVRLFEVSHPVHNLPPAAGKLLHAAAYFALALAALCPAAYRPPQALCVSGGEFRHARLHQPRALHHFRAVSVPPKIDATTQNYANFSCLECGREANCFCWLLCCAWRDSLDRGHRQRVHDLKGQIKNGGLLIQVRAEKDADLEVWAANNAAGAFQQVYGIPLSIQRARG